MCAYIALQTCVCLKEGSWTNGSMRLRGSKQKTAQCTEFVYTMVYKPVSVSEEEGRGLTLV